MSIYKSANFTLNRSLRNQAILAHSKSAFCSPIQRVHTQSRSLSVIPALKQAYNQDQQSIKPVDAVHSPYYNIGTALSPDMRQKMHLRGQIPSTIDSFENQSARALKIVRSRQTQLEKYIFMAQLRNNNTRLFYKLLNDHIEEFAPIIYTPTVGEACQRYSDIYPFLTPPGTPDGLYLTLDDLPHLDQIFADYKQRSGETPDITVMTDGSRILGLGDLGLNGMPISMGKLQLYVAGAGVDPRKTLPIILDFGTNNEKNLAEDHYLGVRDKRPNDKVFYNAMDKVLKSLIGVFPDLLVQFEDFSSDHAFGILKRYKDNMLCFNDDVQGTGAVILSGLINAFKKIEQESNVPLSDHRIVFYGAGSAAIGVARQIQEYLQLEQGLSEEQAKKAFYICDSKGLITADRGDHLAEHKVYYARVDNNGNQFQSLDDIIDYVKPTTLIGLSSSTGAFSKSVLERMSQINNQPIVFPLSNPSTKAECTFEDAMKATNNKVIFASGTAFPAYIIPETKEVRMPAQGNNMYMFPGLGLGSIIAKPKSITNRIILRAAIALADSLTEQERANGWLYPELSRIRDVSATIASAVVDQSVCDKICTVEELRTIKSSEYQSYVKKRMWTSNYDNYD